MKLFIWDGEGVLTDWGDGLAVAYAETLEDALAQLEDHVVKSLPVPSKIIDCEVDKDVFATYCWGSS